MATSAPPSYASPQAAGAVRRSQLLADSIRQMQGNRTADNYRTDTAAIANTLSDAILGYARNNADSRADTALAADKTRIGDMIRGQFPDQQAIAGQQLNQDQAFDLTPGANEQRKQQGGIGNLASMIFETTGDPTAALNAGMGQQRQFLEDQRFGRQEAREEKKLAAELNKPIVANPGDRGFVDADGDGQYDEIFNVPDTPGSQPGGRVQSTFIDKDGTLNLVMGDGSVVNKGIQARENFGTVDVGGVPYVINRNQPGASPLATPEGVGGNQATIAGIKQAGEAQTQAKLDLPGAAMSMQNALGTLDQLKQHPGFAKRYGWESIPGNLGVMLPGEGADAQALIDQVTGEAFLTAIQSMRGTGPLSDREGQAATAAITRLKNNLQSPQAAAKALEDLKGRVSNMYLLAQVKAGAPIDYKTLSEDQLKLLATMPR